MALPGRGVFQGKKTQAEVISPCQVSCCVRKYIVYKQLKFALPEQSNRRIVLGVKCNTSHLLGRNINSSKC
jgi:hypothetical protein